MKKIFLLLASACALVACDPVSEDISNGGHITVDELVAKSTVVTDKGATGNGNQIYCSTSAPVNAVWTIGGKSYTNNYAYKKVKIGEHTVTLTALCADGTLLTADFSVKVDEITNPLTKTYFYPQDPAVLATDSVVNVPGWASNFLRFSKTDSPILKDKLPYDVYWGCKTLIYDCAEGTNCDVTVMSGWWDAFNADGTRPVVHWTAGLNELDLNLTIAKICADKNADGKEDADNAQSHELTTVVTSGTCLLKSIYYEE